jgi:type II secretory pathway pseudopilin PulG
MSAMITAAVALTVATGYTIYSGERAAKKQEEQLAMQKQANAEAKASAIKQEKAGEEATNRALSKTPNTNAILSSAEQAAKTGGSSTMLTGSAGIDPTTLQLGKKSTLLGG